MTVTVVRFRPCGCLTELAFPMRDREAAVKMFLKEYPEAKDLETYEFDSDTRPDLYRAYENAGCVRFWRTY